MSVSCCEAKSSELEKLREKQATVLKWVLAVNALMFGVEFAFGFLSRSSALTADSLDMLGDAAVYGFSLYVLNRGEIWRARAGLLKGLIMAAFGFFVLGQATYRFMTASVPTAETMTLIGLMAFLANFFCLVLLYRHRSDDINMRSTWLCSRNDLIANVGVIGASFFVSRFNSGVPDIVIGLLIAGLFLKDSGAVILESRNVLKRFQT